MAAGRCKSAATKQRLSPALLQHSAELATSRRFARALQPAHHQHGHFVRAFEVERVVHRPHQVDQFLIDDADDLLARIERLENLLADRLLGDLPHELPHDGEAHIRLEQRFLDELQPVAHVRFGELPLAAKRFQRGTKAILQSFKHGEVSQRVSK